MGEPPVGESQWDVFISYSSEDRQALVDPLATLLAGTGLRVWWDQLELKVGDSLVEKITLGLSRSRYGVVVLSRDFLAKPWPKYELEGLTARDIVGDKVILPIWYDLGYDDVLRVNPPLAQKKSIVIARPPRHNHLVGASVELLEVVRPDLLTRLHRRVAHETSWRNTRRMQVPTAEMIWYDPARHDQLPPELIRRIRLVRAALLTACLHTMQFWVDGFIRDAHPSPEVSKFEGIAVAYLEYVQYKDVGPADRQALFDFLLDMSSGVPVEEAPLPAGLEDDRNLLAALMNSPEPHIEIEVPDELVWTDGPTDQDRRVAGGNFTPRLWSKRTGFTSVTVLTKQIRDYIDHWNANSKPFVWTATTDDILAKIQLAQSSIRNSPPTTRSKLNGIHEILVRPCTKGSIGRIRAVVGLCAATATSSHFCQVSR